MSGSAALVAATAVGLPTYVACVAGSVAALASSWPDDVEKPLRLSHRGVSHWPLVQGVVLALPEVAARIWLPDLVLYLAAIAAAAWFGCLMHSVADGMTIDPRGIKYLWPLSRRGYHLAPRRLRVRVGSNSRSEWVFAALWSLFVLSYLYVRYRHLIAA